MTIQSTPPRMDNTKSPHSHFNGTDNTHSKNKDEYDNNVEKMVKATQEIRRLFAGLFFS
jgi:hypothetical protein